MGERYLLGAVFFTLTLLLGITGSIKGIIVLLTLVFLSIIFAPLSIESAYVVIWAFVFATFFSVVIHKLKTRNPFKLDTPSKWLLIFALYKFFVELIRYIFISSPIEIVGYTSLSQFFLSTLLKPFIPFLLWASFSNIAWPNVPAKFKNYMLLALLLGSGLALIFPIFQTVPSLFPYGKVLSQWYAAPERIQALEERISEGILPRAIGTFGNTNQLGLFGVLMVIFLLYQLSITKRLNLWIFIGLSGIAIMLSQSRTSLALLWISLLLLSFPNPTRRLPVFLSLVAFSLLMILLIPRLQYVTAAISQGLLRSQTLLERAEIVDYLANELIKKSTVLELLVGKGTSWVLQPIIWANIPGAVDNEYVRHFVIYGIIGVFLLLLVFYNFFKISKAFPALLSSYIRAVVLVMSLACITGEFFSSNKVGLVFIYILCLMAYRFF